LIARRKPLATYDSVGILYEHMFVELRDAGSRVGKKREALAVLAERARPISSSQTQLLPVIPPLVDLFPDGSLRRGTTVVVDGSSANGAGDISLALSLLAAASGTGCWCALVGIAELGAVAAHDLGIDLTRLAVVPRPGVAWAEVTAALIDGIELVVLRPPFPPRPVMARRLVARVKERRSVLVVVSGAAGRGGATGRGGWPEPPDVRLNIGDLHWDGIGDGAGHLRRRRMTVAATGRRSSVRPRHCDLWLPSLDGTAALASESASAPTSASGPGSALATT
jgi:hypothetical protein